MPPPLPKNISRFDLALGQLEIEKGQFLSPSDLTSTGGQRTEEGGMIGLPEGSAQFVVVHIGLALSFSPPARHLVGVGQLEFAIGALPGDARRVGGIGQKLEQELPQLDLS